MRPDPTARQVAAAQRRGDEDHAADFRPVTKDQRVGEELLCSQATCATSPGGFLKMSQPELVARVGDEQPADAAAHAVADDDHLLAQREALLDRIELAPQDRGGVRIRIAARIAVEPELVVAADLLVGAQVIDHRRPGRGRILEAVNDEHDGLVRDRRAAAARCARSRRISPGGAGASSSIFFGFVLASITAIGTVKSAASGKVRPAKLTRSVASGSSKATTARRPSKRISAVTP